jgi:2-polyprenyl-6-hydroxyphenyl methylase/3-demethylubiquinone-9 3-methyltransferase
LERGHSVSGVDISRDLVEIALRRNGDFGDRARFEVGSAEQLPWDTACFDVCLLPELLEHVSDWCSCLAEAVRVLRPGGTLYLSTTNVLCPLQQEFSLPLYSWYPAAAKRHFVKKALTDSPELANFATFPAVHWFSPYRLKKHLAECGMTVLDRFDLIDLANRGKSQRYVVRAIRRYRVLRLFGHVCTPSTTLVAHKVPR